MKNPKKFCYYCNHLIDYKRQSFYQCRSCETVCHTDCIDLNCSQVVPKMKVKNLGKDVWKVTNDSELCNQRFVLMKV